MNPTEIKLGTFQKTEPVSEVVRTAQFEVANEAERTRRRKEEAARKHFPARETRWSRKSVLERKSVQLKVTKRKAVANG
jgi:hypothetical protein